jgi:hypothetical protein
MGTREDIVKAVQQGAEAGRNGDSLLRTAWIKGYAGARRTAEQ